MNHLIMLLLAVGVSSTTKVQLDPETVVTRALEVSSAVTGGDYRVDAATRAVTAADAFLFPSIHASSSVFHRKSVPPFDIVLPGMDPLELAPDIPDVYATGVRLDYILFTGGAVSGARRAARAELEAVRQRDSGIRADVRLRALSAYWGVVRARAGVEAAEAKERRAQRLLTDSYALDEVGMATPADLAAARERVAAAAVYVIRSRALADNAHATLRSLLRLDSNRFEITDSLSGRLPIIPDSLESLQNMALHKRPEIVAAKARRDALSSKSDAAGAGSWPDLMVVAQWDYNRPNQRYFPTKDEWNDSWSVGLVGTWTLFDGGKARAECGSLKADAMAASKDIDELERQVLLEVETARNDLCSALAAVAAADASLEAAMERERQVRLQRIAGMASTADLLDAEAQLSSAENLVIETRSSAWITAARLDRAVGKYR